MTRLEGRGKAGAAMVNGRCGPDMMRSTSGEPGVNDGIHQGDQMRPGQRRMVWTLRTGFTLVVGLLGLAAVSTWQIQESLSEEALTMYRRHVEHDEVLVSLRRTIWIGSNSARDFFLNRPEKREAVLRAQLLSLESRSGQLLDTLTRLHGEAAVTEVRSEVGRFWDSLRSLPVSAAGLEAAGSYAYIQKEIVPRRNAVGDALREVMESNHTELERSEAEFASTRRSAAQRLLIGLVLSLILAVAVAVFSILYSEGLERKNARQYEEVARARRDLRKLSLRLMEAQEAERTRLSRELHDEMGQTLATLRLEAAGAEPVAARLAPEIRERISIVRELAERLLQIVRNTSLLLRPSLLDDLGLGPALQWQAEDFTRRTGVPCRLDDREVPDDLPDAVRTCVYRILQESLHNCEKHAAASRVEVMMRLSEGILTVRVEDDGRGFGPESEDPARSSVRLGLLGMRERAAGLGGSLDVNSTPGKGVRITLRLPVLPADGGVARSAEEEKR